MRNAAVNSRVFDVGISDPWAIVGQSQFRIHRSNAALMPSPFFKKVEGREGIMPSTRPDPVGTPYLWELSSLPDFLESRLRLDAL